MSRSGYSDECDDNWILIRWRGAVASAIRGRRGQTFLREALVVLDAMPEKRLDAYTFARGGVCLLGAVAKARGIATDDLELDDVDDGPVDTVAVSERFGIGRALAAEIMFENDEAASHAETPEHRYERMRRWVASLIREEMP